MGNLLHPVGPERPAVYWRRRVVLLLAVLGLAVLVVTLPGRGGRADASPDAPAAAADPAGEPAAPAAAPPERSPESSPEPSENSSEDDVPGCEQEQLGVSVATDASSYGPQAAPRFTVTATNAGAGACVVDLASVALLVTSGEDRVWSSQDCQEAVEERRVVLEPGDQEQQALAWQRVRSAEGCAEQDAQPEPGRYQVRALVGELASRPTQFSLD